MLESTFSKNLRLARYARSLSQAKIAEEIGVSRTTYCGYEAGKRTPDFEKLVKIAETLYVSIDELFGLYNFGTPNLIRESSANYAVTHPEYTLEAYWNLPDSADYELLEGKLIHRNTPTYEHQMIVSAIGFEMMRYIKKKKEACKVVPAPFSVVLSEENATLLQPDISVICDSGKIRDGMCYGAPDIVIEVISPATVKMDYGEKLGAYLKYDVREYWIIDPSKARVMVYSMDKFEGPMIAGFGSAITSDVLSGFSVCMQDVLE